MDSTTVANGVGALLEHYLPGLDPTVRTMIIGLIASAIVSVMRKGLGWVTRYDSRLVGAVKPWWEAHAGLINPVVAALLGWLLSGGNPIGLLAGAAGRGIVKAGGSVLSSSATAAGLKKARVALLVLGVLVASEAVAPQKPGLLAQAVARTAFSFGPEVRFREGLKPDVALKIQPALIWGDHLSLRPWASRSVLKESGNKWETGAFLAVVF